MNSPPNLKSYIVITIMFRNGKQKNKKKNLFASNFSLFAVAHFQSRSVSAICHLLQRRFSQSDFGSLNSKSWWLWSIVLNNTQIVFIRWHDNYMMWLFNIFVYFKWSNRHCINQLVVIFETFNTFNYSKH